MSDEWKYKELPRASGKIAPAQWNPETEEWEVFTGLAKVQDVDVKEKLEQIEQTQSQILAKLNDTIDTRLTGSIIEYDHAIDENIELAPGESYVVFEAKDFSHGMTSSWWFSFMADFNPIVNVYWSHRSYSPTTTGGRIYTKEFKDEGFVNSFQGTYAIDKQNIFGTHLHIVIRNGGVASSNIRNLMFFEERPKGVYT